MNESPYDGQWRQAAWLLVSRGARMVEYWHWNTLAFGTETYWGGVLPHSGQPGRAYREIARLGAELATAGEAFADAEPEFDVTVLWDSDSKFALSTQGPFRVPGALLDPDAYRRIVSAFSRGIFDAKRQERLIRAQQLLPSRGAVLPPETAARRFPVLVVAALYTPADEDLRFLEAYARAGGHLVVGPRTGYADREGRARAGRQPAGLSAAAGVGYDELSTLEQPIALDSDHFPGAATGVAELLEVDGAEVLARYRHPHLGRWAAATTQAVGGGRVSVIGTVPDQEFAAALARWLAPEPVAEWEPVGSVTVATSLDPTGRRLYVVHNWGWEPATTSAHLALTDLVTGATSAAGEQLELGPWDVRILAAPRHESKEHAA
jgi:beta-galactosidase